MNKQSKKPLGSWNIIGIAIWGVAVMPNALFASDQSDIDQLHRSIEAERQRLDAMELELRSLTSVPTDNPVSPGEASTDNGDLPAQGENSRQLMAAEGRQDPYLDENFNKSIPLVGSPWRFSFGGYAKVDLIHDFSGSGSKEELVLGSIPVDNSPQEGSYTHLQIAETRFHLETRNSEAPYENSVFLEFDFFDKNSPNSTRLRHAYVRYGNLLAGQTWTLLSELRQLPLILDFAAGDSILGGRTQQLRWTQPSSDKTFGWAIALENYNDSAIYNPSSLPGISRADFPRLASGFTKLWDRMVWSTGAAITQVRFDGSDTTDDESDIAYTATTAGRVYLDGNKGNWFGFGFGYQYGSANDVITFANAAVPNAAIDSAGNLELTESWNTQLGLHLVWSKKYSSNFSYAYAELTEIPKGFEQNWIAVGSAVHANLIYKYDDQLSMGFEVMHGERENVDRRDGDAQRVQFSTIYYF